MLTLPVSTQMIPILAFLTFLPFFLYEVLAVKYIFFKFPKIASRFLLDRVSSLLTKRLEALPWTFQGETLMMVI